MIPVYQIPRNSLAWLLIAQALVLAPHMLRLPFWMVLVWLGVVGWRIQVYRGIWRFPSWVIKLMMMLACCGGIVLAYGKLYGLEPMVAMLVLAFLLKILEMFRKRDAILVVFIGFFVTTTQFLFDQSFIAGFYGLACSLLLLNALLGLNQSAGHAEPFRGLKLSAKLILQSLPLMILLFILMPRLGNLWAVPTPSQGAKTGVSDSMSPGDLSRLSRSGEVAFRATFKGEVPPKRELYWRGLVFSDFDGRRWTQSRHHDYRQGGSVQWSGSQPSQWQAEVKTFSEPLDYDVIIEPTNQNWLFSLPLARSNTKSVGFTRDYRLVNRLKVHSRMRYDVRSYPDYQLNPIGLTRWQHHQAIAFPQDANPVTQERAKQWLQDAGGDSIKLINRLMRHYNQSFVYTLRPPRLGLHTVDEFLWQYQRGFCEHYASSFVFFLRAAGIPARVVTGYQGGEVHPDDNYVLVHQFDAHAWAEVWLEGLGWKRFDPTAAVAPERIEQGLESVLGQESEFLSQSPLSLGQYRHIQLVNWLRLKLDALDYAWQRWVLSYDADMQQNLLMRWLGGIDVWRIALLLVGVGGGSLLLVAALLLLRGDGRHRDRPTRLYLRFCRRLARAGIRRQPGEAPGDFCSRVCEKHPQLAVEVRLITRLYEQAVFAGHPEVVVDLQRQVRRFLPLKVL